MSDTGASKRLMHFVALSFAFITSLVISLVTPVAAHAAPVLFSWDNETIIQVAKLPDTAAFKNDNMHFDLGYRYKQVAIFFIPIWNYDGSWCGYIPDDKESYFDISRSELEELARSSIPKITLPDEPTIDWWNSYGGKVTVMAGVAVFMLFKLRARPTQPQSIESSRLGRNGARSEPSSNAVAKPAPIRAPNEMWYVEGDTKALGPYPAQTIERMLQQGSIDGSTGVAKFGAQQWVDLADEPAFASLFDLRQLHPVTFADHSTAERSIAYAGFWIRFLAYVLDLIFVFVISVVVGGIVAFAFLFVAKAQGSGMEGIAIADILFDVVGVAITLFYYIFFPRGRWQATPGKRLCGIYLVRVSGKRVTGWLAFGRSSAYFLSTVLAGFGFFMIGWTSQKIALHDILCGTRVVHGKL